MPMEWENMISVFLLACAIICIAFHMFCRKHCKKTERVSIPPEFEVEEAQLIRERPQFTVMNGTRPVDMLAELEERRQRDACIAMILAAPEERIIRAPSPQEPLYPLPPPSNRPETPLIFEIEIDNDSAERPEIKQMVNMDESEEEELKAEEREEENDWPKGKVCRRSTSNEGRKAPIGFIYSSTWGYSVLEEDSGVRALPLYHKPSRKISELSGSVGERDETNDGNTASILTAESSIVSSAESVDSFPELPFNAVDIGHEIASPPKGSK